MQRVRSTKLLTFSSSSYLSTASCLFRSSIEGKFSSAVTARPIFATGFSNIADTLFQKERPPPPVWSLRFPVCLISTLVSESFWYLFRESYRSLKSRTLPVNSLSLIMLTSSSSLIANLGDCDKRLFIRGETAIEYYCLTSGEIDLLPRLGDKLITGLSTSSSGLWFWRLTRRCFLDITEKSSNPELKVNSPKPALTSPTSGWAETKFPVFGFFNVLPTTIPKFSF